MREKAGLRARLREGVFPFFYFLFSIQIQIYSKSNLNIVSNILLIQNRIRTFGRFSKINFATFKTLLFSNSLLSLFSFTSKPFSNLFPKTIQTTQPNKSNALACMHNDVVTLMMNFNIIKNIFFIFHEHKNSKLNQFNYISKVANVRLLQ